MTAGGTTKTLAYDPLNRLDTYNPGTASRFIYDGDEVAAVIDSTGAIERRYVRGDGADELLVSYPGSGTANRRWALLGAIASWRTDSVVSRRAPGSSAYAEPAIAVATG